MTIARRDIVDPGTIGMYHCMARCVRRAFLCGFDEYSGNDYEHRKAWVQSRLQELVSAFAMDVFAYSVMSNHLHVVVRNRPDATRMWSDEDVARRWLAVFPKRRDAEGQAAGPTSGEIDEIVADPDRVAELRFRLGDISWFMKSLNEFIARRANREDDCKGRFWEGRFKCQRLLDESAVLSCMAYVDLNPVRAKLAKSLEESEFTSAYDRIVARQARQRAGKIEEQPIGKRPRYQKQMLGDAKQDAERDRWLARLEGSESPFRGMGEAEYLRLLDWTGRQVRADKPGAIPADVMPILEAMQINTDHWLSTVERYGSLFHRVAGRVENLVESAKTAGRKWFRGVSASTDAFGIAPGSG